MSETLETLQARLVEVLEDPNTRYRGDVRLSQLHRNEWPKLWEILDAIVAWWPGMYDDDEERPETPIEVELDEDDEIVAMEELPEIPEPGEEPRDRAEARVITSGPIPPPSKPSKLREHDGIKYDEFVLPDSPE